MNLNEDEDIREAYGRIIQAARDDSPNADIQGVTLQPMVKAPEIELLIGAKKDIHFGPFIFFGLGGIFADILEDHSIGLPPLNRTLAQRLMENTKAFQLLKGYRSIPGADLHQMEQLLICLSHLLVDFPEIEELYMNPVLVKDGKPIAMDARICIRKSETPSPRHLVISPYPARYESEATTRAGVHLFIRPIKPEDAPLLVAFFDALSLESRYHRFFNPVKSLSRDMLIRLTQIDYDRHIGLVAFSREGDPEKRKLLGVGRVILGPDRSEAEFSIAVADIWHGKGIGRTLLEQCLDAGRDYGVGTVHGIVLAENQHMLNLGREMGFRVSRGKDARTYELSIDL
jgi:acetyltransferase